MKDFKENNDITVYREIREQINAETGEILTTDNKKVVRKASTPEFIMFFTQSMPYLTEAKLTAGEMQVLWIVLSRYVSRSNVIIFSSGARDFISGATGLAVATVSNSMTSLLKKQIFVKTKYQNGGKEIVLNPHIFGKGYWEDIQELRYRIEFNYDFKNLKFIKTSQVFTTFEGADELQTKPHKIVDAREYKDEKGTEIQEITVAETTVGDKDGVYFLPDKHSLAENNVSKQQVEILSKSTDDNKQISSSNELKLTLVKEENRRFELENKQLELKNKQLELLNRQKELENEQLKLKVEYRKYDFERDLFEDEDIKE